jgi:polyribonucleotide nucleotidyltransferase
MNADIPMGLAIENAHTNPFEKKLTELCTPESYQEDDESMIFSDITQAEDQYGCVDFKMSGSIGVTAIQMDTKLHFFFKIRTIKNLKRKT